MGPVHGRCYSEEVATVRQGSVCVAEGRGQWRIKVLCLQTLQNLSLSGTMLPLSPSMETDTLKQGKGEG